MAFKTQNFVEEKFFNLDEFRLFVLQSFKKPILIFFYIPDNEICAGQKIVIERFAEAAKDMITVVKIDVLKNSELRQAFLLDNVPAIAVFKNGERVSGFVGALKKSAFIDNISEILGLGKFEKKSFNRLVPCTIENFKP